MKIKLKKSVCHDNHFWEAGSVIEAEKNFAAFTVGCGDAVEAGKDEPLSPIPEAGPARRSLESDAMEKAAASIVQAVAKAATGGKKGAKDDLA
jgi:hypothetical protein